MEEKREKKQGLLGHFLAGLGKKETVQPPQEEQAPVVPPPQPKQPERDPNALAELKGAMLQLWDWWQFPAPAPVLTLKRQEDTRALPLDENALGQERLRIGIQLEQAARERVQQAETAKQKMQKAREERGEQDGPEEPVSLDAACRILLAQSKMMAWMFLFPPIGQGEDIRMETIGRAMQDCHVDDGVDITAVSRAFQEKLYFTLIPIAWGTLPVQGTDGSVEELFPRQPPREVQIDENGLADYRSQSYVQTIEKGTVICRIHPPVEGSAGTRVDGQIVEPKPVRPAKVPMGTNTTVTEDGLQLVATMDGHLEFSGSVFQVKPFLEVKGDVDYSTGNIDFRGDVHIMGDVRENFSVRATGTITIDGLVEAANVEAGGDLVITRGVLGDNRALIKSGGSLRAKYLENCVAYAGKCIYADCIMSSHIYSDDKISVMSGRGTVIGGTLTAAHTVQAQIIGSQSGTKTEITLGVLPYVQEELRNNEDDMRAVKREQEELDKLLAYLEEQGGMSGGSEKLAKARLRKSVLGIKEEKLAKRRRELEPMSPELEPCKLVCGTVYPITIVKIGAAQESITSICYSCTARYDAEKQCIKFS